MEMSLATRPSITINGLKTGAKTCMRLALYCMSESKKAERRTPDLGGAKVENVI